LNVAQPIVSHHRVAAQVNAYARTEPGSIRLGRWLGAFTWIVFLGTTFASTTKAAAPKSFESDGIRISYFDEGQGEPVILVHGFSANAALNWIMPGIVRSLREDFRVIALDIRGHGQSSKPHQPEKYGLEVVHDITRLMDHLQIPQAHVVGYSLGAMITCKLMTTSPDRLITATLGGAGWPRAEDPRQKVLDDLVVSLESNRGVAPLLKALTPVGYPVPTDEQLQTASQLTMLVNDPKALAAMMRGRDGLIVTESELRKNQIPVLALIGDLDPLKTMVDDMVGVCPKLEVVVIQGADHMNAFTARSFQSTLCRFLEDHRVHPVAEAVEKN